MVVQSKDVKVSKDAQAKTLIMRAWRERWTDVQWGIHARSLVDSPSCDGSLIANCILQQALGGPGPNSLVLSYLMHSIYSQIITSCAVFKSVCKYDGFHKPYCVASLLELLDNIKDRVILNDSEKIDDCMELAFSLASIVHWLLTCMYSSLENLSDLSINDVPVDIEDSKIVLKCRNLMEYFLTEPFISGLIHCAVLENDEISQNIKKMSGEVAKFSNGHHHQDIAFVIGLIEKIGSRGVCNSSAKILSLSKSVDGRPVVVGSPSIQTALLSAALLHSFEDVSSVANDLKIIKDLKGLTNVQLFYEVMHSAVVLLLDCLGRRSELQILGSVFLVLPTLIKSLSSIINASPEEFIQGLNIFLANDSVLDTTDTKLGCFTLEILLTRFQELNLITESAITQLLERKPQNTLPTNHSSSKAISLLKTESMITQIFTTLDGVSDFTKNQDAMLATLYEIIGDNLDLILTAACCTKKLKLLSLKLLKLNQASRQVNGEAGKASTTRAMIFDITFLILCVIGQTYGSETFPRDEPELFFLDWYSECMVEDDTVKNPESILNRCDQNKVEMLINQYLQGDNELKTSLVFWHELCTNAVGVVRDILFAWEAESANFADVKKLLDVFRFKICSLPVCISAWLCSHIQVDEQSGKARYILNQFLTPANISVEEEHFQERYAVMSRVITKMLNCVQIPSISIASSPISPNCAVESKPISDLYKKCFASMQQKGLVDIETMLSLNSLLTMSGSHYFVQGLITEMMENQCAADLLQWSDMLYGIFHFNLSECTAALLRVAIPSLLHYWNRDSNFVEPQILALASLSVDCVVSYYLHSATTNIEENEEPSSKRRKVVHTDGKQKLKDLQFQLKELFGEFDKILKSSCDARPQAIFVLRFLEHLSMKTVHLPFISSLPNSMITNLMSLMGEEISAQMLLGWYPLTEKSGRANCVLAICNLKHLQNVSMHCCGGVN